MRGFALLIVLSLATVCHAQSQSYRWTDELELLMRVDKLPEYRTDCHVEQFSSYDRTGGNDDGFVGTYSYLRKEGGRLVVAEMKGPGVINRIWTPTPNDHMLHFYLDGALTPALSIRFSDLFSGQVFPFVKPVCGNEVGGFYCYLPITYRESCKIVCDAPELQFIQIQYRNLPRQDVETFTNTFTEADKELVQRVCQAWGDLSPQVQTYAVGRSANVQTMEETFTLKPGQEMTVFSLNQPGRIVGLEMDGGTAFQNEYHKDVVLRAVWDNERVEAVCAPLADFFGYAYGKPAMRGMLMGCRGTLNYCYLPMPFDRRATISLQYLQRPDAEPKQSPITVRVKVYYNTESRHRRREGKLYSVWNRQRTPIGEYHTFLSTEGRGHYVGTIHQAQGLRPGMTVFFEGDDSTHVDGKMRLHGTGSEDYYNGGWYALPDRWDRGNSLSLHGCLDYSLPMSRTGGYRFFLTDKLSFEKEIYHGIEHGDVANSWPVDYTTLAFYYGDRPLQSRREVTPELCTIYHPDAHVYYPQLMQLTLPGGATVRLDRGLRMTTEGQGAVQVALPDVPEGRYRLTVSYHAKPDGADFRVFQRQQPLSDWMPTQADTEAVQHVAIGELMLTPQTNSVTFHVRKTDKGGSEFELNDITLQRVENEQGDVTQ